MSNDPHELRPEPRKRRRLERPGLNPRYERLFNYGLVMLVGVFAVGWTFVLAQVVRGEAPAGLASAIVENPLSADAAPPVAYLLDAAVRRFTPADYGGASGAVRIIVQQPGDSLATPDSLPEGVTVEYAPVEGDSGGVGTGGSVWNVLVRLRNEVQRVPFSVVRLVPLAEKRGGRIGRYVIGDWPYESGGRPRGPQYAPPAGLIRVTPENQDVQVSEHFRLRDFLTKGQNDVWPKYVAMSPRLLDKLELTIQELKATGTPVEHVGVISGFRTPHYNAGGGNTAGRGQLSRHMYGDAMDWFVDNDRDGRMDDLNGDGRVDTEDGRVIVRAAERVEKKHPSLIGGIGLYRPTGAHAGFVHLDTRGYRARW